MIYGGGSKSINVKLQNYFTMRHIRAKRTQETARENLNSVGRLYDGLRNALRLVSENKLSTEYSIL